MIKMKRRLSKSTRRKLRANALKGVKKWHKMPHILRKMKYNRGKYGWGFEGKSPHTRPRKHKHRKK